MIERVTSTERTAVLTAEGITVVSNTVVHDGGRLESCVPAGSQTIALTPAFDRDVADALLTRAGFTREGAWMPTTEGWDADVALAEQTQVNPYEQLLIDRAEARARVAAYLARPGVPDVLAHDFDDTDAAVVELTAADLRTALDL